MRRSAAVASTSRSLSNVGRLAHVMTRSRSSGFTFPSNAPQSWARTSTPSTTPLRIKLAVLGSTTGSPRAQYSRNVVMSGVSCCSISYTATIGSAEDSAATASSTVTLSFIRVIRPHRARHCVKSRPMRPKLRPRRIFVTDFALNVPYRSTADSTVSKSLAGRSAFNLPKSRDGRGVMGLSLISSSFARTSLSWCRRSLRLRSLLNFKSSDSRASICTRCCSSAVLTVSSLEGSPSIVAAASFHRRLSSPRP
mmetsp:Transcript_38243/g.95036  ORF Transcript_38243/g.95036 Transcript_38243/m.95036 type:complete len:252 (-) Transcript_38243:490-1245(-)